jgi:uridine kinase
MTSDASAGVRAPPPFLRHPLFLVGLAIKLVAAASLGSHFATRWFAPFAHQLVASHLANPWAAFMARGEPLAFPYGPGMLALVALPFAPAWFADFSPSGHLALLLLRVPVLAGDAAICWLLAKSLPGRDRAVLLAWWLNPIVLYASYVHGQLDLIPTALLVLAVALVLRRRFLWSSVVLGLAISTKLHVFLAFPFLWIYVLRLRRPVTERLGFGVVPVAIAVVSYLIPAALSPSFREMVLESPESQKLWNLWIAFGDAGPRVYLCPAALLLLLVRFSNYSRLNESLLVAFVGLSQLIVVALVAPQPGWFVWSAPFVALQAVRSTRIGWQGLAALSVAYIGYFAVATPEGTLEAVDPLAGPGAGARAASALSAALPALFAAKTVNVAWTVLFGITSVLAVETYRRGIQSSPLYRFRDRSFLVGIGGDSASGKHTLGDDLLTLLGSQLLTLLQGDDDHRWERGHPMWSRLTHLDPRANDLDNQARKLLALRGGSTIQQRTYDHSTGTFRDPVAMSPTVFVAVLGLHPFFLPSQRAALDLKVFLDPREELRRGRKVVRDTRDRGQEEAAVLAEIERRVPDSERFVRPQIRHADIVVRAADVDPGDAERVELELEVVAELFPLTLVAILERAGLAVEWSQDPESERYRLVIAGRIGGERLVEVAREVGPTADELLPPDPRSWRPGIRGVIQLAVLYGIVARLDLGAT